MSINYEEIKKSGGLINIALESKIISLKKQLEDPRIGIFTRDTLEQELSKYERILEKRRTASV